MYKRGKAKHNIYKSYSIIKNLTICISALLIFYNASAIAQESEIAGEEEMTNDITSRVTDKSEEAGIKAKKKRKTLKKEPQRKRSEQRLRK